MRISVVGLGTVGQWVLRALASGRERLGRRYGVGFTVVGVANARAGYAYDADGLDAPAVLELLARGGSLAELPGVRHGRRRSRACGQARPMRSWR